METKYKHIKICRDKEEQFYIAIKQLKGEGYDLINVENDGGCYIANLVKEYRAITSSREDTGLQKVIFKCFGDIHQSQYSLMCKYIDENYDFKN